MSETGIVYFVLAPNCCTNPFDQFQMVSTHSILDGKSHAVAVCYGAGGLKMFIDGVLETTNSFTGLRYTTRSVSLGDYTDKFENDALFPSGFTGEVDAIRTSTVCSPTLAP